MLRLVSKLLGKHTAPKSLSRHLRRPLRLEALEDRCVPAVLFVDPNNLVIRGAFSTITAAVNAAHAGDTIKVVAGTYHEEQIDLNKAGLTIIGGQVRIPVEEHPGPSTLVVENPTSIGFILDANNVTVEGFTIVQGVEGIAANSAFSGYRILGNTFTDNAEGVILNTALVAAGTTTISGNHFESGTPSGLSAIQQDVDVAIVGPGASNVVISSNHFVATEATASIDVDSTKQSTNIQVLDNSFSGDAGIKMGNAASVKIDSNFILNPLSTAIALDGGVTNSTVAGNTIVATSETSVDGIVVDASVVNGVNSGISMLNNTIRAMNVGISVDPANHTTISGNTVAFSSQDGINVNDTAGSVGHLIAPPTPIPATANTITGNTVAHSGGTGISVTSDTGDTVAHNVADDNQSGGIALTGTSTTAVTSNVAEFNVTAGISLSTGTKNTVSGNNVSFNDTGVDLEANFNTVSSNVAAQNILVGFQLGRGTQSNTLTGNTASGNLEGGFLSFGSSNTFNHNVAVNNLSSGGGAGFLVEGNNNTLTGNTASGNSQDGIDILGINCLVNANIVVDNGNHGIFFNGGTAETVTGNTADRNGGDGIVLTGTSNSQVASNTVLNNLVSGIEVGGSGNTITLNTALGNGLTVGGFDLFDDSGTTTANTWSKNTAGTRNPGGLG
jgi:parallel beta-helix repeat protein